MSREKEIAQDRAEKQIVQDRIYNYLQQEVGAPAYYQGLTKQGTCTRLQHLSYLVFLNGGGTSPKSLIPNEHIDLQGFKTGLNQSELLNLISYDGYICGVLQGIDWVDEFKQYLSSNISANIMDIFKEHFKNTLNNGKWEQSI